MNGVGHVSRKDRVNVVGHGQGSRSGIEGGRHGIDPHHSVTLHDDGTALQDDALLSGGVFTAKQIAPVDAIRCGKEALAQPDLQSSLKVSGDGFFVAEVALHAVAERPVVGGIYGSKDHGQYLTKMVE